MIGRISPWLATGAILLGLFGPALLVKAQRGLDKHATQFCKETYWREGDGSIAHERICWKGGTYAIGSSETD